MTKQRLTLKWSKRERDLICSYPDNGRPDMALVFNSFTSERLRPMLPPPQTFWDKSFVEELSARGYDITTLRFSIEKLPTE